MYIAHETRNADTHGVTGTAALLHHDGTDAKLSKHDMLHVYVAAPVRSGDVASV